MSKVALPPAFLLVFSTVLSITLLSGATSLWLGSRPTLTQYQLRNLEDSRTAWNMGIGCIFGLLGSKATDLLGGKSTDKDEDDEDDRDDPDPPPRLKGAA